MNVIAHRFRDADAFLAWNEGREGRRELVHGLVVDMTGSTLGHVRIVLALAWALRSSLDPRLFEVITNDLGVKTAVGVRFPDVLVQPAGGDAKALAASGPVLVAEVLSPSSLKIDFAEKPREYMGIESVRAYLVLSQDEPRAWLWRWTPNGWAEAQMIEGLDADIAIEVVEAKLSMRDIYGHLPAA